LKRSKLKSTNQDNSYGSGSVPSKKSRSAPQAKTERKMSPAKVKQTISKHKIAPKGIISASSNGNVPSEKLPEKANPDAKGRTAPKKAPAKSKKSTSKHKSVLKEISPKVKRSTAKSAPKAQSTPKGKAIISIGNFAGTSFFKAKKKGYVGLSKAMENVARIPRDSRKDSCSESDGAAHGNTKPISVDDSDSEMGF